MARATARASAGCRPACWPASTPRGSIARFRSAGPNLALLPTWSELFQYTQREATYFGNLFIPGQPRFFCLSPGQTEDERVCGDSLGDCPMTVVGSCAKDCASARGCSVTSISAATPDASGTGQTYLESVTVFLPK